MSQTVSFEQSHLLETFVQAKLGQLAPILHTWYTPDELHQNLKAELQDDLEWTQNLEWAEQFHANFGVGQPQDYLVRTLELPTLGTSWTHIRFRGGDPARPFVDLRSSLNLPSHSENFKNLLERLNNEYTVFKPKHLRLFLPLMNSLEPLPEGAFWEKRYLAAPVEKLRQSAVSDALDSDARARLEARPLAEDFYLRYLETYRELQESWPAHAEYAGVQEKSDFRGTDGAALELFLDGQYAGLVAASRAVEQGLRGFVVDEVVLSQVARGRALGPVALRHLVEHLPARAGDILFGTVDVRNTPAYRSALRSGREDVGGYLWVSFIG